MGNAAAFQRAAQNFGFFNGHRTHQHGAPHCMSRFDILDDGVDLALSRAVDHIGFVFTDHFLVGGHFHHIHAVDLGELAFFGFGRTGHPGEFFVHTEIVLEGDGGQCLAFPLDLHIFLGFQRLMETVAVTAAEHQTAGKFINDDDFAVFHHIVAVLFKEGLGPDGVGDEMAPFVIFVGVEIFNAELSFDFGDALFV